MYAHILFLASLLLNTHGLGYPTNGRGLSVDRELDFESAEESRKEAATVRWFGGVVGPTLVVRVFMCICHVGESGRVDTLTSPKCNGNK